MGFWMSDIDGVWVGLFTGDSAGGGANNNEKCQELPFS
jgi:hypothetical protein